MQFGNQTRVNSDGKNLIDDTPRQKMLPLQAPLVVPQFDDEEDSSSCDDELAMKCSNILEKSQNNSGCSDNNDKNNHNGYAGFHSQLSRGQKQQTSSGEVQWDHVQELQDLTNANATLISETRDLRQQVRALQIQLEAQAPVPGLDVEAVHDILFDKENLDHDVRDVKIVHQAKILRTLKRLLQREKQFTADAVKQCKACEKTNKQLEEEIDTLKLKYQRSQTRAAEEKSNSLCGASVTESPTTSFYDTSSYDGTLRKFSDELKAKNTALQQELKKTQRALIREVGDDVPLEDIVNNTDSIASGSSRRGRAQHIIILKSKVKRLQTQLVNIKQESIVAETHGSRTATVLDVDQRAQHDLSGQQMHRQKMMDQLLNQRDELQDRLHRLTRNYDALKARVQILDRERQETRDKFQVLIEKSRTDDALIDALRRQLETWKTKLHQARRARTADGMKIPYQVEQAELERLRKIVSEYTDKGGDRLTSSALSFNGAMPQPSEVSQYRAIAMEKERLAALVCSLKAQLEDKDKQLRSLQEQRGRSILETETPQRIISSSPSLPAIGDDSISRIPRLHGSKTLLPGSKRGGVFISVPPAPLTVIMEQQQHQLKEDMETLRNTFRESMREKDNRIAKLEHQLESVTQSSIAPLDTAANGMSQELHEFQEENDFLRQEFHKLKTRYEALLKEKV